MGSDAEMFGIDGEKMDENEYKCVLLLLQHTWLTVGQCHPDHEPCWL